MAFSPPPSDDDCRAAVEASTNFPAHSEAARSIGVTVSQLKSRIRLFYERGLGGTKPVLPGYRISKTTAVTNEDGDIVREFIQQRPELGEAFEVPPGHAIKGVSALVDSGGRTIQQWIEDGEVPAVKLGSCWYIPAEWLFPILPPDHPDRREADRQP